MNLVLEITAWVFASQIGGAVVWYLIKTRDRREEAILADCEREAIRSGRQSPTPTQLRPRSLPPISASAFRLPRGM